MHNTVNKTITLLQLAGMLNARVTGTNGERIITGVNTIRDAGPGEVCFMASPRYAEQLKQTKAAAVLTGEELTDCPTVQLVVENVNKALITALTYFAPTLKSVSGIDPTATVDSTATVDASAAIGPCANIGPGVKIGPHTVIGPGCVIGQDTTIGSHCRLDANVVVYHRCRIGNHCIILANSTIGATGFGYSFIDGRHQLIPHNGGVILEDGVEIGANSCVDRAKFGNTIVGAGTKIDNLVQVGHNVRIGKACLLVGQVALAGSCVLGDGVVLAGNAGVADHIVVGDGVIAGTRATLTEDVAPGQKVLGFPARPMRDEMKSMSVYHKLPDMAKELKALAKKVENLEAAKDHKD
jgi:UDP-3-O-[3-hydroxymyristoyl] glucosamine N-acyltransferase